MHSSTANFPSRLRCATVLIVALFATACACTASASEVPHFIPSAFHAAGLFYATDAQSVAAPRQLSDGLAKVMALLPISFVWKEGPRKNDEDIGFIAQDVEKIVPEV